MVNWVADRLRTLGATIELADVGKQTLPDGRVIDLPNVILGTLGNVSLLSILRVRGVGDYSDMAYFD